MLANRKYEELSYPQKSDNVRPYYSRSSRENETPIQRLFPISILQGSTLPPGSELTFMVNNANQFMISAFFSLSYVCCRIIGCLYYIRGLLG